MKNTKSFKDWKVSVNTVSEKELLKRKTALAEIIEENSEVLTGEQIKALSSAMFGSDQNADLSEITIDTSTSGCVVEVVFITASTNYYIFKDVYTCNSDGSIKQAEDVSPGPNYYDENFDD